MNGPARDVIDWISWMEHLARVNSLCDSTATALVVFNCFKRSASAERGRRLEGVPTV